MSTTIYVSWGGTDRTSALREALRTAQASESSLVYLAVLDDDSFADLDKSMLDLVADELEWVLETQIEMAKAQVGAQDTEVRLVVRYGGVVAEVTELASSLANPPVLVGAPAPVAGHDSVSDLVKALEQSTSCVVSLVDPT